jgi:hypothetical protein
MEIQTVSPAFIDRAWRDGAEALGEACEKARSDITASQLKMMLARGEMTLLALQDEFDEFVGWAAVQFQQLANQRVLMIHAIVAHNASSAPAFERLKGYARDGGASAIRGNCTESIARLWGRLGFTPAFTVMEIDLWADHQIP